MKIVCVLMLACDEVCRMSANWHKLLGFMALIGILIAGDAIRSWLRK